MKLVTAAEARKVRPKGDATPEITVYFGEESADIGVLRLSVPGGGGGMREHTHNGSDVVITPVSGSVVITKGEESVEVTAGDSVLILRDELVSLHNPGSEAADVLVSAGPAAFVSEGVLRMPQA